MKKWNLKLLINFAKAAFVMCVLAVLGCFHREDSSLQALPASLESRIRSAGNPSERKAIYLETVSYGEASIPLAESLCKESNSSLRDFGVKVLAVLPSPKVVPTLELMAADSNDGISGAAIKGLQAKDEKATLRAAEKVLLSKPSGEEFALAILADNRGGASDNSAAAKLIIDHFPSMSNKEKLHALRALRHYPSASTKDLLDELIPEHLDAISIEAALVKLELFDKDPSGSLAQQVLRGYISGSEVERYQIARAATGFDNPVARMLKKATLQDSSSKIVLTTLRGLQAGDPFTMYDCRTLLLRKDLEPLDQMEVVRGLFKSKATLSKKDYGDLLGSTSNAVFEAAWPNITNASPLMVKQILEDLLRAAPTERKIGLFSALSQVDPNCKDEYGIQEQIEEAARDPQDASQITAVTMAKAINKQWARDIIERKRKSGSQLVRIAANDIRFIN